MDCEPGGNSATVTGTPAANSVVAGASRAGVNMAFLTCKWTWMCRDFFFLAWIFSDLPTCFTLFRDVDCLGRLSVETDRKRGVTGTIISLLFVFFSWASFCPTLRSTVPSASALWVNVLYWPGCGEILLGKDAWLRRNLCKRSSEFYWHCSVSIY